MMHPGEAIALSIKGNTPNATGVSSNGSLLGSVNADRAKWLILQCFGFGSCWAWIHCALYSNLLTFSISASTGFVMKIESPASAAGAMVLLIILSTKIDSLIQKRVALIITVGIALLGEAFMLLGNFQNDLFAFIGAACMGASTAGIVVMWGEQYKLVNSSIARRVTIPCSISIGVLLFIIIYHLPWIVGVSVTCLLPVLSVFLLTRLYRLNPFDSIEEDQPVRLLTTRKGTGFPLSFALSLVVFGLAMGLVSQRLIALSADGPPQTGAIFSIAFCLLAVMTIASLFTRRSLSELSITLMLPIIGIGLLGFVLFDSELTDVLSIALVMTGYFLVEASVWIILANQVRFTDNSPMKVFGIGQLGRAIGIVIGMTGGYWLETTPGAWTTSMVVLTLYLFILIAVFIKPLQKVSNTEKDVRVGAETEPAFGETGLSNAALFAVSANPLSVVSQRFELTTREEEILGMLLQGNNHEAIAKRLSITRNTVKAHVNHIYQKAGVRTKQELIDTVTEIQTTRLP